MTAPRRERTQRHRALARLGAAVLTLATGATVWLVARPTFHASVESQFPTAFVVLELAALSMVAASGWLASATHPAAINGLTMIAVGLVAPMWAGWQALPDLVRAPLVSLSPLVLAGTVQVATRSTRAQTSRPLVGVYSLVAVAVLVNLTAFNPFAEPGCLRVCTDLRPLGEAWLDSRSALGSIAGLMIAAAAIATRSILAVSPSTTTRVTRGAGLVALVLLVVPETVRWATWSSQGPAGVVLLLPYLAGSLVAGTIAYHAVRAWRTRVWVERLAGRLNDDQAGLHGLVGSDEAVRFAIPDEDRWVDVQGNEVVEAGASPRSVIVSDRSGPVARLEVAPDKHTGDIVEELTPPTRLALKNAQLAAATRARVRDVQTSRRRVVATGDAERQRIERDLHDGAQQRLVSASIHLSLARQALPEEDDRLTRAQTWVEESLQRLRQISHGMFPSVLATDGLWAALDDLVRGSAASASLDVRGDDEVSPEAAMAAYAAVASVFDHVAGRAAHVRVTAGHDDTTLDVSAEWSAFETDPAPTAWIEVIDRVSAAGGHLTVSSTEGSTCMKAVIPCG